MLEKNVTIVESLSLKSKLKVVLILTLKEGSVRTVFSAFGFSAKCWEQKKAQKW